MIELEKGETIDQALHQFPLSRVEFLFIAPAVKIVAFQKEQNATNEDFVETFNSKYM